MTGVLLAVAVRHLPTAIKDINKEIGEWEAVTLSPLGFFYP